ncbi:MULTISPECIES: GyrI-like domain-containing protein [Bacillaceae]|uniref:GyrI-like domain-containing protein n=1 Tax=Bacillaceae TaxID=186817 RepID=UPI003000C51B
MSIQVVEKESMKVVGISWSGTYSETGTIPNLFNVLEERLEEIPNKVVEPMMVAPFHSRETELTYYVTKPVEKIEVVPKGMVGFTIPAKNYVYTVHNGKADEVDETYKRLFTFMDEYGYEQDHQALSMEIYKQEHKERNANGELYFEIYLPVKTY